MYVYYVDTLDVFNPNTIYTLHCMIIKDKNIFKQNKICVCFLF